MRFDWSGLREDGRDRRDLLRSWWSKPRLQRAEDVGLKCLSMHKRLPARPHRFISPSTVMQALNAAGGVLATAPAERRFP